MKKEMKKAKNIILPANGHQQISDDVLRKYLNEDQLRVINIIRKHLSHQVKELCEKFNSKSKYLGFMGKETKPDCLYIYFQKERAVVDINLPFVKRRKNYQDKSGWLTGWRIPYIDLDDREERKFVLRLMLKAFNEQ